MYIFRDKLWLRTIIEVNNTENTPALSETLIYAGEEEKASIFVCFYLFKNIFFFWILHTPAHREINEMERHDYYGIYIVNFLLFIPLLF